LHRLLLVNISNITVYM